MAAPFLAAAPPSPLALQVPGTAHPGDPARDERLQAAVEQNYDFVWRTLRHLGCHDAAASDCAQQVMCVLARHFDRVAPGALPSFLYQTAVRVASTFRRGVRRRPESTGIDLDELPGHGADADELVDELRKRALLQRLLDGMSFELRVVFVLHEIEELSSPEVASILGVPANTVSSRLRRAREQFHRRAQQLRARFDGGG
ncbi:MAG: RNA polymerase sigma factor [Polyangiaceae bacterium]